MSLSEPFIQRPVATSLRAIAVLGAGLVAWRLLPVSALPQVDYPTLVVSTQFPGASAETMASSVTAPLERWLGQMPSLDQMSSQSSFQSSSITVRFALDRNIDDAEQDVQAAINAASNLLPPLLPAPPTYSKSNPADAPILTLAVTSDALPLREVDDYADSILAQKISQVAGVGLVSLAGSQKPAVRVEIDPLALAGTGLDLEDVRSVVTQSTLDQPKGSLDGPHQAFTLDANDQLERAAAYRPLVLATSGAAPVRLGDVATLVDGVENSQLAAWANGRPAVLLNVQRQPGANIIQVADRVKALLPALARAVPPSVRLELLGDRTETIRASVRDVEWTLAFTVLLVVLVIFFFLRSLRATLVPSVAVPLSIVGTFGAMYLLGYSLDNLSLMALTISTGFVVDDAIVMIENVSRHLEAGLEPQEAALVGAREIGFTIVSLTVSLIAVLIPLLFMRGLIGRLFREFAMTLAVAIALSALISLTLTPMMCGRILRRETPGERRGFFHRLTDAAIGGMARLYDRTLRVVLRHQPATLAVFGATLALTGILFWVVPKGFFPVQDTGLVLGFSDAARDVSFTELARRQQALARAIQADPDVATVASFIGSDGVNPTPANGRLSIALLPRAERRPLPEALAALRAAAATVRGISLTLQPVQDLTVETQVGRTPYRLTLGDADPTELTDWTRRLTRRLASLPELREVSAAPSGSAPTRSVRIDRASASLFGVSPAAIDATLYDAFGQRQIATIFTQLNQYRVILELTPGEQADPDVLSKLYVKGTGGQPVPLSAFARFGEGAAAPLVDRIAQFPASTISFDLAGGVSLGRAVAAIERAERELSLPVGLHAAFSGTAAQFGQSLQNEIWLVLAALFAVYVVLGVLYESYVHPLTILSTLPSAGVGALLALIFTGEDFSVIALIGLLLLIGIVKKNAILMIDFALDAQRGQGLAPNEAIYRACLLRFRPIMMTTLAALLGGLPLAIGAGVGSELRRPLGISIVGGLLVSQLLTLYTTPVVYLAFERLRLRLGGRAAAPVPGVGQTPVPQP